MGDGAGTGWPIAVGGDAVGRLGALGRADGLADGLGAALDAGGWLGLGLAATGLEATDAGCEDATAEAGDDTADEGSAAGLEIAVAPSWLLVQAVASRPVIMTAQSSAVRHDRVSRGRVATGSG
ncbi:MAG TPA: hypothetical protein VN683_03815 [Acidothermaceae bacterium]|nr:hypothetical protein [Acidothermaceae bacterium]